MNSDRNTANANNEHKKVRNNFNTARTAILKPKKQIELNNKNQAMQQTKTITHIHQKNGKQAAEPRETNKGTKRSKLI